jgi:hypothetical protein
MKAKYLVAAIGIATSLAAMPAFSANTLFKFDGGIGSQPFRSAAGVAVANTVAGANPGGAPWPIKSLRAEIRTDGSIRASVKGVLLGGTDNIGTRGGPRKMVVSLFCRNPIVPPAVAGTLQTTPYNSQFVDLNADGDFRIEGTLTNASGATPPADCGDTIDNRPVLLIRTVTPANPATGAAAATGNWFAAGILEDRSDESKGN